MIFEGGLFGLMAAAGIAAQEPLGFGGFEEKAAEAGGLGLVIVEPALFQVFPILWVFAGQDELVGSAAVGDGVGAGNLFSFGSARAASHGT